MDESGRSYGAQRAKEILFLQQYPTNEPGSALTYMAYCFAAEF
jgi:hypothetical protein